MHYDKYQIYALWRRLKKIWNMKRFDTATTKDLLDTPLDDLLISEFIAMNQHVEYMANYAINLVNEMRCGLVSIQNWAIMVMVKALVEGKFPELKDCSRVGALKRFAIFNNRDEINGQIDYLTNLATELNNGINEFSNKKFTLYELDDELKNNAYRLFVEGKISPVFYIKGMQAGRFSINIADVKEYEYKRFITFSKIILKLYLEVKNANQEKS